MSFKISKEVLIHLGIVALLAVLALVYCKPVLDKKILVQHDLVQATGAAQEMENYYKKTGEFPLWTNSMFGGMPSYTIRGYYPNSWTSTLSSKFSSILPDPANYIFLLLLGFYIAMVAMGNKPLWSLAGAIAFGFSSYSIISLEAGHASKVLAVAYAAPLAAGVILLLRGDYIKGALLTLIFMILELYSNHIQITYYLFIALLIYVLVDFVLAIRQKRLDTFIKGGLIAALLIVITVGATLTRFTTFYEYSKYTTRGPSELTPLDEEKAPKGSGLDRDYAFNWSYGISETFTYLIPNFNGGKSSAAMDKESNVYHLIDTKYGRDNARKIALAEQWPMYWGAQPMTSGPAYLGAIVCFLAVLGLVVIKNPMKWWLLSVIILFTMLAWGSNFSSFNYFMFDYFPAYNKFRAVTMIHALVAIFVSWLAVWGLSEIFELSKEEILAKLKVVIIPFAALLVIFWLGASSLFTFESENEKSKQDFVKAWSSATENPQFGEEIYEALVNDRIDVFKSDALRSLVLILLAATTIFLYTKLNLKKEYIISVLALLMLWDGWQVSARYLNDKDFKRKKSVKDEIVKSDADRTILEDKDPDFRVYNQTVSTFNDASTSYYHKSIGGYSAAKMRRFQDLVDRQIYSNNMAVLNMFNVKYIIVPNQQREGTVAIQNPNALGHAWFVDSVQVVQTPDEEMKALNTLNPQTKAVVDASYAAKLTNKSFATDSSSTIELVSYMPDKLVYESNNAQPGLAVFSEVYYNSGLGWEAYLDGKPVEHIRVNYILRGMEIPAGKHSIEFKFIPKTYFWSEKVSLVFSIISILTVLGLVFLLVKKKPEVTV